MALYVVMAITRNPAGAINDLPAVQLSCRCHKYPAAAINILPVLLDTPPAL